MPYRLFFFFNLNLRESQKLYNNLGTSSAYVDDALVASQNEEKINEIT